MPKSNSKWIEVLAVTVGYGAYALLGPRRYRILYAWSQELAKKLEK